MNTIFFEEFSVEDFPVFGSFYGFAFFVFGFYVIALVSFFSFRTQLPFNFVRDIDGHFKIGIGTQDFLR